MFEEGTLWTQGQGNSGLYLAWAHTPLLLPSHSPSLRLPVCPSFLLNCWAVRGPVSRMQYHLPLLFTLCNFLLVIETGVGHCIQQKHGKKPTIKKWNLLIKKNCPRVVNLKMFTLVRRWQELLDSFHSLQSEAMCSCSYFFCPAAATSDTFAIFCILCLY